jgi:hypothetical protein
MNYQPHTRTLFRGPDHWRATKCLQELAPSVPTNETFGEEQRYLRLWKDGETYCVTEYNWSALEEL